MKGLATWVMNRQGNTLSAVCGFAILGLILPPLFIFSLASLALVTMRRGARQGLWILLGCSVLMVVITWVSRQPIWRDIIVLGLLWSTAYLLALIYRQSASMSIMVINGGIVGLLMVLLFHLMSGDPAVVWLALLEEHIKPNLVQAQLLPTQQALDALLESMAALLTAVLSGVVSVLLVVSLLMARWWQAMLYNPGGFRKEFHHLRLGHTISVVMLGLLALALIGKFSLAKDMAAVVWALFAFQGLAVIHNVTAQTGINAGWLAGLYFLLAIFPLYLVPVLSGMGFMDTWLDFRQRVVDKLQ